jgi:glycosyltransferase involved in cell wall biosynthesis
MLSIIIPTLNEEEGIAKVLCDIPEEIKKQSEVIVVDVSSDCTPLIAERLGAKVVKAQKKGKGRQMRLGVEKSKGDILIFLDGDGTDPAQYIPKLVKKLDKADLVLGCRSVKKFKKDDKTMRDVFRLYSLLVQPIFYLIGFRVSDPLAGFRAIRRKDWERLNLKSNGFEIETEMNIKAMQQGFVIKEIAIPHLRRAGGLTKSKFAASPKMWFRILRAVLKYLKDEKMIIKVKELREKLGQKISI